MEEPYEIKVINSADKKVVDLMWETVSGGKIVESSMGDDLHYFATLEIPVSRPSNIGCIDIQL